LGQFSYGRSNTFGLCPHLYAQYADDTQIYGFRRLGATDSRQNRVTDCVSRHQLDAVQLTPVECIQDRSTEVCVSPLTNSFWPINCWLQFY